jgi:hypothetical protein
MTLPSTFCLTRCLRPGPRSRRDVTKDLAVVNYIQYVMRSSKDVPEYPQHYLESQAAFTEVLKKWRPKAAWLLGKAHWEPSSKKDNFSGSKRLVEDALGIVPICSDHPYQPFKKAAALKVHMDRLANLETIV